MRIFRDTVCLNHVKSLLWRKIFNHREHQPQMPAWQANILLQLLCTGIKTTWHFLINALFKHYLIINWFSRMQGLIYICPLPLFLEPFLWQKVLLTSTRRSNTASCGLHFLKISILSSTPSFLISQCLYSWSLL